MPTCTIILSDTLDRFVATQVEAGHYADASEVIRAALRTLEREEQEDQDKLEALRAAIEEGDRSGIAEGGVFARVRMLSGLPQRDAPVE